MIRVYLANTYTGLHNTTGMRYAGLDPSHMEYSCSLSVKYNVCHVEHLQCMSCRTF